MQTARAAADKSILYLGFASLAVSLVVLASPNPVFIVACVLHAAALLAVSKKRAEGETDLKNTYLAALIVAAAADAAWIALQPLLLLVCAPFLLAFIPLIVVKPEESANEVDAGVP